MGDDMNVKRMMSTSLAVFAFALLWNGIVHMVLLRDANMALDAIARPAAERNTLLFLIPTAAVAILFVYSYALLVHTPGIKRGLAHGAFFGLLAGFLVDLNQFLLYPIPGSLAFMWFLFGFMEFSIYGALTAWLYPTDEPQTKTG